MKSMTGYGTAEGKVGEGTLFIELKGVNHRYSEMNLKIPGRMSSLDNKIRKSLQKHFSRGKVDIFIKEKQPLFGGLSVSLDIELAKRYQKALKKVRKDLGLKGEIDFMQAVGLDRILKVEEKGGSYDRLWGPIEKLIIKAANNMLKMRKKEGAHILKDQRARLRKVAKLVERIRSRSKKVRTSNISRIRSKMNGTLKQGGMDEQRLQMEAALLGGRQDIAEEVVRLASHIKQYGSLFPMNEAVGRKLDFLLQEMNREINTIGSKAADTDVSRLVVDCKSELERLREQVQNIE